MPRASSPVASADEGRAAHDYSAWFETPLGRQVSRDEQAVLRPLLEPVSGHTVLDAGAGDGRLAVELAATATRVVGVDVSRSMLRLATRRAREAHCAPLLAAARLEALPFRQGCFDVVVVVTVLCVARDPRRVMRELARVLPPRGRLVVGELGRWSLWAVSRWVRGGLGQASWRDARFWTWRALHRVVREAGLRPCGRTSAVFYPPSAAVGRLLRPLERALAGRTSVGAAFLAVAAEKSSAT